MSKQNKKLLAEIQNGLKQVDEGIAQLEMLEVKVENASTISIKEKYRQDMKREIKRLQRLRDIFRQNVNNPAIVEQHRLVEARKRIETEMEKFRDHEKEYKSKRPTKAAMLVDAEVKGKFNYGSGSSFDGEYGEEGNEMGEDDDDDLDGDGDAPQDINLDKQWLASFVSDTLRSIMGRYDTELDKIQNKKTKGGQKKNRDKINALKAKKSHFQHIKDRAEELQISMDYLEPGKIRQLRIQSRQLSQNADEEPVRVSVLQEIDSLIELSEQNRRSLPSNNASSSLAAGGGSNSEAGRVNAALESLDVAGSEDIVDDDRILGSLRIGNILDAQDYLGTWHLSIVIDDGTSATNDQPSDQRTLHFLPFMKANRDEVFSAEDQSRLAPAFSKQEAAGEPQQQLQTLQTYLENHLRKTGQNPATVQQNKQLRQQMHQQQMAAKEETKGAAVASSSHQSNNNSSQNSTNRHKRTDSQSQQQMNNTSNSNHQLHQSKQHQQMNNNLMQQSQQTTQQVLNAPGNPSNSTSAGMNSGEAGRNQPSSINGSGLQLQKGKGGAQQQSLGNKAKGHHLQQQEADQSNRGKGARHAGAQMSGDGRTSPAQQESGEDGVVGGMLPPAQQLFRDMPAFGSGQFLLGAAPGSSDSAFKPGSGDLAMKDQQLGGGSASASGGGVLLQHPSGSNSSLVGGGSALGGQTTSQPPIMMKDTSLSERKHNLDLLETSFRNILTMQDQEVIDETKQPLSVWEEHDYPRVPLFNRKENFSKFDLETLFFAFYYQQNTYQQYLAAVELKKKNWKFVKKFETWFKKDESDPATASASTGGDGGGVVTSSAAASASAAALSSSAMPPSDPQPQAQTQQTMESGNATTAAGSNAAANAGTSQAQAPQKDVGRYVFFDYENGWQQLVRDDFELDLSQIENELVVQPVIGAPSNATTSTVMNAAANGVTSNQAQQTSQSTAPPQQTTGQTAGAANNNNGNASRNSSHAQ